jgi:hypothetical protein
MDLIGCLVLQLDLLKLQSIEHCDRLGLNSL